MSFSITATGHYVPELVVTNDDLAKMLDTSDQWIRTRVGVRERHLCTTETTADLGYQAALRALEMGHTDVSELDLILCATVSGDDVTPATSCMIQHMLGATCPAMDINAACSAFIYMLDTADGFFARKKAKKILAIGAERLSRITDWEDRSTCVIFGDGAGAVLLEEGDDYLASRLCTYGGDDVIKVPNFAGKSPFYKNETPPPYTSMNGQETFKFAVNAMCRDLETVIEEAGLKESDIRYVVPHQANYRIIDAAARRLPGLKDAFRCNIERYGNTSSASIPILLDELNRGGELQDGDYVAMCSFGGGLSSAAAILRWHGKQA